MMMQRQASRGGVGALLLLALLAVAAQARVCRGTDLEARPHPGAPTIPRSCKTLDLSHSGLCKWWARTASGKKAAAAGKAGPRAASCDHGAALLDLAAVLRDESVHHGGLQELRLNHNGLSAEEAGGFVRLLATPRTEASGGSADGDGDGARGKRGLPALTRARPSAPTVSLTNNHLGDQGARAVAQALGSGGGGGLGTAGCVLWPPAKLDLTHNGIGNAGATALAAALEAAPTLRELVLWHNEVGAEGARALARALKTPTSRLRALRLWSNSVGDGGTEALAGAVRYSGSLGALHTLDLAENGIGNAGAEALALALGQGCALNSLELNSNSIGEHGLAALATSMANNHRLRSLGLARNPGVTAGGGGDGPAQIINMLIQRNLDALMRTKQEL